MIRRQFEGNKRCEVCHKAIREGYVMSLEGYTVLVCSGAHAELGRQRWQEKKDKNIRPGVPNPPEVEDEMLGDNIGGEDE